MLHENSRLAIYSEPRSGMSAWSRYDTVAPTDFQIGRARLSSLVLSARLVAKAERDMLGTRFGMRTLAVRTSHDHYS